MKNTTPTQAELANYITNTGCDFEAQGWENGPWYKKTGGRKVIPAYLGIRIALTPFGLPSHLPPMNPAGLSAEQITEGGKYRAVTRGATDLPITACDSFKGAQAWVVSLQQWRATVPTANWDSEDAQFYTYRLPASVPFPDWVEMSKTPRATAVLVKPGRALLENPLQYEATVKDSLTVQPALRVIDVPLKVAPREQSERRTSQPTPMQPAPGETRESFEAFQFAVTSIPEPLPTLRPIAEMPEKVPEKAVRFFCYPMSDSSWSVLSDAKCEEDTHFIDILLPVESTEDKMRAEFEKGMQERGHILRRKEETYDEPIHHFAWVGFKLAKSTTQP